MGVGPSWTETTHEGHLMGSSGEASSVGRTSPRAIQSPLEVTEEKMGIACQKYLCQTPIERN